MADEQKNEAQPSRKEKKTKLKKRDTKQNMLQYTYRDMGQEYIMRRKMWRAIFLFITTAIGLVVFIALYISEMHRVQETYRTQYQRSIENLVYDIEDYMDADGDFELRYRMIISDISSANSFAFLLDDFVDEQKTIDSLYTVMLKYPEQTKSNFQVIHDDLQNIIDNENGAYEKIDEFVKKRKKV